jgi:hypothetical protein
MISYIETSRIAWNCIISSATMCLVFYYLLLLVNGIISLAIRTFMIIPISAITNGGKSGPIFRPAIYIWIIVVLSIGFKNFLK